MFFVIDVGNSHTVTGMYENDELTGKWRLKSDAKSTADELAISYKALFEMAGIGADKIQGVIIASVVPTLETPFLPIQDSREAWLNYSPTWVEWSLTAAGVAVFIIFFKI